MSVAAIGTPCYRCGDLERDKTMVTKQEKNRRMELRRDTGSRQTHTLREPAFTVHQRDKSPRHHNHSTGSRSKIAHACF